MEETTLKNTIDKYIPYFMEIRKRLLFLIIFFLASSTLGFIYSEKIIKLILGLFSFKGVNIVFTSPFQFVDLALNSAVIVGVIAIFPLILQQAFSFLKPALKRKEFRMLFTLLPVSLILFIGGMIFGIYIMKYVITFFYQKSIAMNIGNFLDISRLLSQMLVTASLMGLAFQYPIVLTALVRLKLVSVSKITSLRVYIYCIIVLFVMLLPPTDLLSDLLLTLPLVFLFEITLILNKLVSINLKT